MPYDQIMGGTEEGMTPELPLWADALSDAVFIHDCRVRLFAAIKWRATGSDSTGAPSGN